MREIKKSGVEWIGDIPASWGIFRLKDYVDTHFSGCWGEDVKNNQNDILCIRIADFDFANQRVKTTTKTYRNYTEEQIKKYLLKDKDLIVEKSGGGDKTPVGRVVIYSEKDFPRAIFANFCECIRLNSSINHIFVAYCLKALYQTFDMHYYFNQTTGLQNLNIPLYLNVKICVPSLIEQNKIINILNHKCGQVNSLIVNQETQIEKLKQYKQSLITEVVTKGLNPDAEMKDSGVEWIGAINSNFNVQPINALFSIEKRILGKEPEQVLSITQRGIVPKDITNNEGQMANSYSHYQIVHKGDFAMNHMDLLTGGVGISEYEGVTSPDYRVFVLKNIEMNARYFLYVFETYYRNKIFYAFGQGAANIGRWRLPAQNFKTISIPVPPIDIQNDIVSHLDEQCSKIDKLIEMKQAKIAKLNEYKKSLIYEYVTGKKEVC